MAFATDRKLFYTIQQQDGSLVIMDVPNSRDGDRFVKWVEAYEGNYDIHETKFTLKENV